MLDVSSVVEVYGTLAETARRRGGRSKKVVENKVWFLKENRLFDQASEESIENCEHLFTTTLFPKGARVFDMGDPTRLVYLVKRGKVRIARLTAEAKEITVAFLGAGDIFGEETLFEPQPRTTVAICQEESLLCTARADDMFGLLSRQPQLALNVAKILSERLVDVSATMEDLAYARVPDRLLNLFERLAQEHGATTPDGVRLDVKMTHADIASLIGSTRETVSAELSNLAKAGRIRSEGGHITLLSR